MTLVVIMIAGVISVGRDRIALVDALLLPDPTLSFTTSNSAGAGGTQIHLTGAPAGAFVEFSGEGVRGYSTTFTEANGVAALVPPMFRGGDLATGDFEVRLVASRGPLWTSSGSTTFKVGPPVPASSTRGIPSLFALGLTHGLLVNAVDVARAAEAAGAPSEIRTYADELFRLRAEVDALSRQFELVAWGNSPEIVRPDLTIDPIGIGLVDQLTTQYMTSLIDLGGRCADRLSSDALAGVSAESPNEAMSAATGLAGAILACDPEGLLEVSARTGHWLSALDATIAAMVQADPGSVPVAALFELILISWTDEAIRSAHLLRHYDRAEDLKAELLSRTGRLGRVAELSPIGADQAYVASQLEGIRKASDSGARLIASVLQQEPSGVAAVVAVLKARGPQLATPAPAPPGQAPGAFGYRYGVRVCGTMTEHRSPTGSQPGSITVAGEQFAIAKDVRERTWPGLSVGMQVCINAAWSYVSDGRTTVRTIVRGESDDFDLKFFQYTPP